MTISTSIITTDIEAARTIAELTGLSVTQITQPVKRRSGNAGFRFIGLGLSHRLALFDYITACELTGNEEMARRIEQIVTAHVATVCAFFGRADWKMTDGGTLLCGSTAQP